MKLSRKFLFVAVAVILSVSTLAMTAVYAIGEVSTCNNNLNMTATSFVIFDDVGEVSISFVGYTGITTEAIVESKIQKKTLFWWSDVDNGETDNTYDKTTLSAGDTIRFSNIEFMMEPVKETGWKIIGSDISWFVPCESLAFLNNSSNYKAENCEVEQDISSDYLIAQEAGIGETAILIAQSVADPAKRDTLKISIIAKAN